MFKVMWKNTKTKVVREFVFDTLEEAEAFVWIEQMSCDYVIAKVIK